MAHNEPKGWRRWSLGPTFSEDALPEDDQPVTIETQAVDAMRLATDNAALEHAVADMTVRLRHAEHELDELRIAYELAAEENEQLRRQVRELTDRELPLHLTEYRRMVEQDKTDQPPADRLTVFCVGCGKLIPGDNDTFSIENESPMCENCDPNGRPDLAAWTTIVEPASKNGTA